MDVASTEKKVGELSADFQKLLGALTAEVERQRRQLDDLPRTEEELADLLAELAAATDDRGGHFARFPRTEGGQAYESPAASEDVVREDWTRVLRRHDEAVRKLTLYARALALRAA